MVQKYQHELTHKKNLIIADLDSKEKSIIEKMNQNPKIWNSKSLQFDLKTSNNRNVSSISLDVTITKVSLQMTKITKNNFIILSSWMQHDKN